MNLREFCKSREYTTVIGTTYSFDPLFFERVILPDLRFGHGGEILIIGDGEQLNESINRCNGQLKQIGNTFVAEPVYLTGAFHPKILLKIGRDGALLLIGSGNMTNGGWGGNQELFAQWTLEKEDPNSSKIINKVINSLMPYANSQMAIQTLNRAFEYDWVIGSHPEEINDNLFITNPDSPLSEILAEKWNGKRYHTLRLFTGSTDQNGAFIEWCHNQFGIEKCIIASNEENISFDNNSVSHIPVEIIIAPIDDSKRMHAKSYIFEGNDGLGAVMGSANCSRRAWLMSPNNGGNVEAIVIYDTVDENDLEEIIARFPSTQKPINEISISSYDEGSLEATTTYPYKISSLTLDRFNSEIRLELTKELPEEHAVEIHFNDSIYTMNPNNDSRSIWATNISVLPDNANSNTLFGEINIIDPDSNSLKTMQWINDLAQIKAASKSRRMINAVQNFIQSETDSEYQKVLKDIAYTCTIILDDPNSFDDPPYYENRKQSKKDVQEEENIAPITSENLYQSMSAIDDASVTKGLLGGQLNTTLSFMGLMKFFFSFDEEVENAEAINDDENFIDDEMSENDNEQPIKQDEKEKKRSINSRFQKRFQKEMEGYFNKLRSEDFRNQCTVSQLKQAAAYPLIITVFGKRNGWIENDIAEQWVTLTVDILFKMIIGRHTGLCNYVRERYEKNQHLEIFHQVIGDGTLWIAILTAISEVEWQGDNGYINKAFSISSIINYQSLLSSTDPNQLAVLVKKHRFKQTADWISRKPFAISNGLSELENHLNKHFDRLIDFQLEEQQLYGDIIFGKIGWGTVLDEKIDIYKEGKNMNVYLHNRGKEARVKSHGFFINLRIAMNNDQSLTDLASNLS